MQMRLDTVPEQPGHGIACRSRRRRAADAEPSTQRSPSRDTGSSGTSGVSSSRGSGALLPQQRVDLARVEAKIAYVDAEIRQFPYFQGKQVPVPAGLLCQTVVGKDVGPALGSAQVAEFDHRHAVHPELPCRQQASMPGDHAVLARPSGIGELKPNSRIDPAISATWASLCCVVRSVRRGSARPSGRHSTAWAPMAACFCLPFGFSIAAASMPDPPPTTPTLN